MNKEIRFVRIRRKAPSHSPYFPRFSEDVAQRVRRYHEGFPGYEPTALQALDALAQRIGLRGLYVKDESTRFGLNAFKALGGSYALGRCVAERIGLPEDHLNYCALMSDEAKSKAGALTFVTTTDGNHGRGVAWTAKVLGQRAEVFMPKGTVAERVRNIEALGARVTVTDMNYDDTVRFSAAYAEKIGGILTQDTAFEGYETIPEWIMQGYTTMACEAVEQLGDVRPTHVFLQAGVGSMAAAVAAYLHHVYADRPPLITVVEPHNADCFYRTAAANDGTLHAATGELKTIMAGLACGVPCSIAWSLLSATAEGYIAMPDSVAANGMRILANPLPGDPRIVSGESGAAGFGLVCELMRNEACRAIREELQLDERSVVLCFSTEGATDRANYGRIVWDGAYAR